MFNPNLEGQLIAAIVKFGDVLIPQKLGITIDCLDFIPAKQALQVIYEYADAPHTKGQCPPGAYLKERMVQLETYNDANGSLADICTIVRTAYTRRRILAACTTISQTATSNPVEAFKRLQEAAFDPVLASIAATVEASTFSEDYKKILDDYKTSLWSGQVSGLPTPFPLLTKAIQGFQPGQLYVFFAPEKSFKTFIALQCIATLYKKKRRTLIVSSEMPIPEINERLVCLVQGVSYDDFIQRILPSHVMNDLWGDTEAINLQKSADIHHFAPSGLGDQAISQVIAKIRELNQDGQLALVLWDGHYRSAKSSEWEDVYDLARKTRKIPLDKTLHQVPLLLTTQAGSDRSRVAYRAYAEEATALIRLHVEDKKNLLLETARLRRGAGCKIRIQIDLAHGTFRELGYVSTTPTSAFSTKGDLT